MYVYIFICINENISRYIYIYKECVVGPEAEVNGGGEHIPPVLRPHTTRPQTTYYLITSYQSSDHIPEGCM